MMVYRIDDDVHWYDDDGVWIRWWQCIDKIVAYVSPNWIKAVETESAMYLNRTWLNQQLGAFQRKSLIKTFLLYLRPILKQLVFLFLEKHFQLFPRRKPVIHKS